MMYARRQEILASPYVLIVYPLTKQSKYFTLAKRFVVQIYLCSINEKDQAMIIPKQRLQELRRIRIVTKNYAVLRGLQNVPFGLLFLFVAAFELKWLSLPYGSLELAMFFGFIWFLASIAIHPIIGRYYDRMFGSVQRASCDPLNKWITSLSIAILGAGGMRLDKTFNLPISATGLALALILLILWWQTNAFRTHLLVIAFVMITLAFAPLLGFPAFHTLFIPGNGGYELFFGVMMTIGGLCDHLLLLRAFRQTQKVYHDKAI